MDTRQYTAIEFCAVAVYQLVRIASEDPMIGKCLLLLFSASTIHCGGSSDQQPQSMSITGVQITGDFAGQPVAVADGIGLYGVATARGTYAGLMITSFPAACALVETAASGSPGNDPPNTTVVTILVSSTGGPVPTGTFLIGASAVGTYTAQAFVEITDAKCMDKAASAAAASGSVTFTVVSSSDVKGQLDLTFASGDHLTAAFGVPVCNFELNALQNNGLGTCR